MSIREVNNSNILECPICMDVIEFNKNCVTTECGHSFHCSCLMQNTAHNGFGCPYCRSKMAEEPEEDDDDEEDEYDSIEDETVFEEDALTSFRMFHQRINGDDIEEEPNDDWESISSEEDDEDDEEEDVSLIPDSTYIAKKLIERGINMEDLVKNILFQEHSNWGQNYSGYERRSSEIYGQFRAVISQYRPQSVNRIQEPTIVNPIVEQSTQIIAPNIAESKSSAVCRRREFLASR